jgi:hypothetical protein
MTHEGAQQVVFLALLAAVLVVAGLENRSGYPWEAAKAAEMTFRSASKIDASVGRIGVRGGNNECRDGDEEISESGRGQQ